MAVDHARADTTSIETDYRARHPRSQQLYERAQAHFPSGVTHDGRWMEPFPLAVEHAAGAYKWDVDGNRLIDYWQGHGALLLGHAHPAVVAAVQAQVVQGTHYGANHEGEIRWAEQVKRCFPQIEQLRFTASGTEATLLALRLARAYTGRPAIVRLAGHFHGWHDLLALGIEGDQESPAGLAPGIVDSTIVVDATIDAIERVCTARDDIAAIILEPSGASYGKQPLAVDFLRDIRELCTRQAILLICDEVVTGFRVAPGGMQEHAGVDADLTSLAKILAGGLPGGAIGGRADIMRHIAFGDASWNTTQKIRHQGTFNGNPLAAAAGIATLELVVTREPQAQAAWRAEQLRTGLNAVLRERNRLGSAAYGESSIVHVLLDSPRRFAPGELPADLPLAELKAGLPAALRRPFRLAMLTRGIDLMRGTAAFVSAVHSEEDIAATVAAFSAALDLLD
jgi:glutamate-1-semialdehyde 2,1-aminomutase